ncbi:MAG: hypothetical protein ACE5EW_07690, partial [Thermoplasmata archaeon]
GIANFVLRFHPQTIDTIVDYMANDAPCNIEVNNGPDLDHDGQVNIIDLAMLLGSWGPCTDVVCLGDITCDGRVGRDSAWSTSKGSSTYFASTSARHDGSR